MATLLLAGLLVVGCGSSTDDNYVFNPGPSNPVASVGSVEFHFANAQSAIVFPAAGTTLVFEFFAGDVNVGTLVKQEEHDYSSTITIADVPTTTRALRVTAIDANGFPVSEFSTRVVVPEGGTVVIDGAQGATVAVTLDQIIAEPSSLSLAPGTSHSLVIRGVFSNGATVEFNQAVLADTTFVSSDVYTATVDASGLVELVANPDDNSAVITATYGTHHVDVSLVVTGYQNV